MEQFLPLILNGVGGAILGPIVSKLLGGKLSTGTLGGIIGGLAGGFGMDAAGLQMLGGSDIMSHLNNFLQGGIGGGALGALAGLVLKK